MVFAIAGLIVAFVLILAFREPEIRHCRWRARRSGGGDKTYEFKCMACGAEARTKDGKPPRKCLRPGPRPGA